MNTGLFNSVGPRGREGGNGPGTSSASPLTQSTRLVEISIPPYDQDNNDSSNFEAYDDDDDGSSVMLSHIPLGAPVGGPPPLHLQQPPQQQQQQQPGGPQHSQSPVHGPPQQSQLHGGGQPTHGMNQASGQGPPGGPGGLQIPPPPPQNGQDQTLSNVLHFLQSEWRRYERDRNEWEVERAEMRARIALLEGERRSFENVKLDLMRRIKMLEYALRMERSKQLTQSSISAKAPSVTHSDKQAASSTKEDNQSAKGSVSSSPRSDDIPLPGDQRFSISSLPAPAAPATSSVSAPNGIVAGSSSTPLKKDPSLPLAASWPALSNGKHESSSAAMAHLLKPPAGRDAKSRARSREYLKQCLQEVNYLTSPPALNPLPNRPLLSIPPAPPSNPPLPTLPLALPNLPSSLGQGIGDMGIGYNGRPRKGVPDMGASMNAGGGKEFPLMNGATLPPTGPGAIEKDSKEAQKAFTQPPASNFGAQAQQNLPGPSGQPQHPLASEILPSPSTSASSSTPADVVEGFQLEDSALAREEEDLAALRLGKGEEFVDEVDAENEGDDEEGSDKVWKARRTLRNHLDAVRALAFHPLELCLATGSDDYAVKIWRIDSGDLAAASPTPGSTMTKASTTEIEPQLTFRGHTGPITRLVYSASKHLLYSASMDATIHVWDVPSASHPIYAPYNSSLSKEVLVGHTDAVWDLALVRDESLLISCGADGAVKVWIVSGTASILKLSWGYGGLGDEADANHPDNLTPGATALEPLKTDLKKVAVAYQNSAVKIYDIDTGVQTGALQTEVGSDEVPMGQVNQLVSHPTMPLIVTGHEDKHIRIWDIVTGQCTYTNLAHLQPITSLSIDSAGFYLVSGSHDCSIRFWDLINTRQCTQEAQPHREKADEGVLDVEFHPTLPFMASAGADGTVKLFASS